MTQDPVPGGHLRVGHAEREVVTAILQEAAADGRLEKQREITNKLLSL